MTGKLWHGNEGTAFARFDESLTYRYHLTRHWDDLMSGARPPLLWIMLNPSTADEKILDPTVRKCIHFAKAWGYGGIEVCNMFALRSTDPRELMRRELPIGVDNNRTILERVSDVHHRGGKIVCAWGNNKAIVSYKRIEWAREALRSFPLWCLRLNGDGSPGHPLYIPNDTQPTRFAC